jgi:hypothetical protein
MKQRYDNDFLIAFTKKYTITLITSTLTKKTNRDSIIHFKCIGCTNDTKKGFRQFVNLPYCKSCGNDKTQAKKKETCLEKYGCENPSQNADVQAKRKETCLENYGCEHPLQNADVQAKMKETFMKKYGCENPFQNADVQAKMKETFIKNYGCEHPFQNADVQAKRKETFMKNYGCEHPFQNADVQAKRKETFIEKYGCENPAQNADVQAKMKETFMKNYGCENPSQNADVQAKMKETFMKKYGCENPSQNADVADKASRNAYKAYDYTFPSGKIVRLQGYEKYAIDKLLSDGITEMDIVTDRSLVPKICYKDQDSKKKRRYFIDIFIPSKKIGIEVKSTWTFEKKTHDIIQKQQAFKDSGYTCEIWVLNNKGEMVTVHK